MRFPMHVTVALAVRARALLGSVAGFARETGFQEAARGAVHAINECGGSAKLIWVARRPDFIFPRPKLAVTVGLARLLASLRRRDGGVHRKLAFVVTRVAVVNAVTRVASAVGRVGLAG